MQNKIKISICTGMWQRHDIFKMFAKGIQYLIENTADQFEYRIIVAGSEGSLSKNLVQSYGFDYIEIPNQPLAIKMNATTLHAGFYGCDYVLCIGSDDVIHPSLMRAYLPYINKKIDYIGVTDFYFYDTQSDRSAYWGGYRDRARIGHTAGAGRLISSRLMQLFRWQPWEVRHSHILDDSMGVKLKNIPHTSATFSLKQTNSFGLDIKSPINMTPFELWDNTQYIDNNIIKKKFDYLWQ